MTLEMIIIAIVRVLGSLPVLRWPLIGGLIAVLVDLSDLFMMNLLHLGGVRDYQSFDKYLDQVYLLNFLIVSRRWEPLLRNVALSLYLYRLLGFLVFEFAGDRDILLFFPNFFEFWFLAVAGLKFFRIKPRWSNGWLLGAGAFLVGLKVFQEYAIHYRRWLDSFTAVEAVEAVWRWLGAPFH